MYERRRNLVVRADGRLVNVARPRGQIFVCATGCCCGRTVDGYAAVPTDLYHNEWERRRLRAEIRAERAAEPALIAILAIHAAIVRRGEIRRQTR